jgi:hypothetical protein
MSNKKIQNILKLVEICENNLKNAKSLLLEVLEDRGSSPMDMTPSVPKSITNSNIEALEVVEGYFDGESMIGDNGKTYLVPQNYASKTQLIVGDRMKWILTEEREIFKLIQPASRDRVTGTFGIEGGDYVVMVDNFSNPIKILKASATYAMKHLGMQPGDEVAIYVPKDTTPTCGAFINIVKSGNKKDTEISADYEENSKIDPLDDLESLSSFESENDYF